MATKLEIKLNASRIAASPSLEGALRQAQAYLCMGQIPEPIADSSGRLWVHNSKGPVLFIHKAQGRHYLMQPNK